MEIKNTKVDNNLKVNNLCETGNILTWKCPLPLNTRIILGVKKVIVQPDKKIIVVIFYNGDKSIVKCGKDDTFSVENGVAIAITKYVLGSGSELKRLVKNATIQEVKKKEVVSDKIEVGDDVKIPSGKIGDVDHINGDDYWVVYMEDSVPWKIKLKLSDLKLIKKGEKK